MNLFAALAAVAAILIVPSSGVAAETPVSLERQLLKEGAASLVAAARRQGDAQRGAIAFYQRGLGCATCHTSEAGRPAIGPDLSQPPADRDHARRADPNRAAAYLVEAVLEPSKAIHKGFETLQVVTDDGRNITGLFAEDRPDELVLREASGEFALIRIAKKSIEERQVSPVSLMPLGLVNQLAGREQFLDLLRYLLEISEHGPLRARQLRPPPGFYETPPLAEYEQHVDHAGLLAGLNDASFRRGEAIYQRLCFNCHGTRHEAGSLPAALRFASGKFRHGGDPYSMYQTLTRGFGLMPPQTWMVPRQKYDVIHYLREAYLKHNPSQYASIDADYLASLPRGDTFGPEPTSFEPWAAADYGPSLINTYEVGGDGANFAYKGIAVRLDAGQGGVARGNDWLLFDHDTLRVAAIWSHRPGREGRFIDFNGIHFNGRHQTHPRTVGQLLLVNHGLGWANPESDDAPAGDFNDPRLRGRDNKPYGPLPRAWGRFRGLYHHGRQTIISYSVGETDVLELPGIERGADEPASTVFARTFNIGPRPHDVVLQVADYPLKGGRFRAAGRAGGNRTAIVERDPTAAGEERPSPFAGEQCWEPANPSGFDLADSDYTIAARIRTVEGGAIFCQTQSGEQWVPDGKVFFVRGGRLCFDIGWVGVVESRRKIDDGQWHDVAIRWRRKSAEAALFIDGRPDRQGALRPAGRLKSPIVRLGFGAPDFPQPRSYFKGDIDEVRFHQRALSDEELAPGPAAGDDASLIAHWRADQAKDSTLPDMVSQRHDAKLASDPSAAAGRMLRAGLVPDLAGAEWLIDEGQLRLRLPAGQEPIRTTLWLSDRADDSVIETATIHEPLDLASLTRGGPPRWPEELRTVAVIGADDGPFAVDWLTHPAGNPWSCQMRFTGLDFSADGQAAFVCTWDGDVWRVTGVDHPEQGLSWRRIASGLFQPLGLKIVAGQIYVGCRDQIVILHDLNGDGETDFYENFNNDHQVTEHFHEFAMGLQTDAEGNFYYAKSARHALPAIVPHHGTLLRVSGDGRRTDILATGFRAANGVCVNGDGTFLVTDQEGHWTPKNRINWVEPGGFYGNMFSYHDISDTADDQMRQPLCWLTNAFDRSPGELLWVTSEAWRPLTGSLLELSYGAGKIFIVPHEKIAGQWQGGLATLPLPIFPTGVMRGRFHPQNGQLYTCGMFAWAGNQTAPGGLYRVRYTGKPIYAPVGLRACRRGIEIKFSGPLAAEVAGDAKRFTVRAWSLKRTANYGSAHHNERQLTVAATTLGGDGQTVFLELPDLRPTWCMSIEYSLRAADGTPVVGEINNTIHHLGDD